ncbi:hypothetical protein GIB67_016972 [Kingdonia uniflora]|uniref:Uncharacterized protein n=1 Tax=Kingdonia uniflora TaxID=39325 RepID=A0A7J7M3Q9_9MAGN|nr:hypothetical protein GIB67_016972 [Kingdonia uniflora]
MMFTASCEDVVNGVCHEEEKVHSEVVEDGRNPKVNKTLGISTPCMKQSGMRGSYIVRSQHRARLRRLLDKLMKQHNWKEASGVMSMLLKGMQKKGRSPKEHAEWIHDWKIANGFKSKLQKDMQKKGCLLKEHGEWMVAMELLSGRDNHCQPEKIWETYGVLSWKEKRTRQMKKLSVMDRYQVRLESLLSKNIHRSFRGKNDTDAFIERARTKCNDLVQEMNYGEDPVSNMMLGLFFYELWYSSIPEEMKLGSYVTPSIPEISEMEFCNDAHDMESELLCGSNSSMAMDMNLLVGTDSAVHKWPFCMGESVEMSENEGATISNCGHILRSTSIFHSGGKILIP